jgi:hypothetical protein
MAGVLRHALPLFGRLVRAWPVALLALIAVSTLPSASADPVAAVDYAIGDGPNTHLDVEAPVSVPSPWEILPPILPNPLQSGMQICTPLNYVCATFQPCEGTNGSTFAFKTTPLVVYVALVGVYAGLVEGGCGPST